MLIFLSLSFALAEAAWQAESSFTSSTCDLAKLQALYVTENSTCQANSVTQQCRSVAFDQWTTRVCHSAPPVYPERRVAFVPCQKFLDISGPRPRSIGFYLIPQDQCYAHTSIDKIKIDCTNASAPLVYAPCETATPAVGGKGVCVPWTSEGATAEFTCETPNQNSLPTATTTATATDGANGTSTAAAGTATTTAAAGGASSTAAVMCAELGAQVRPCTRCKGDDRCAWYATLGNALDLGGSCLPKGVDAPAATKEVATAADCLDTCDDFACSECLTLKGCVWCDTAKAVADKLGGNFGSTGSCEKTECTTKAAMQTTCSSAGAVALSLVALVVAGVTSFL